MLYDIAEIGHSSAPPSWADGTDVLKHHVILYVVKGEGEVLVNGASSPFGGNALIAHAAGTAVELRLSPDRPALLYWVCFDRYRLRRQSERSKHYQREDSFPAQGTFRTGSNEAYRLMHRLAAEEGEGEAAAGAGASFARQQLLHEVIDVLQRHADPTEDMDKAIRLKRTVDYMQRHYNERIRMSDLAEWGRFHPAYYSQIFKQWMNKTPMAYLTHLRMNKAKEMLMTTDEPVSHVAAQVGYGDEFYFSKRFKETHGYPPSAFPRAETMKVISLSAPYTDHLFALGLIPSAAQVHSYLQLATQTLSLPEHASEPWRTGRDIFLDLEPDLIVCKDNVSDKAREHINDIAPIITIPWKSKDVYRHLEDIAELVGRRKEAARWLDDHLLQSERWRKRLQPAIGRPTVAICVCRNKELRMYGARNIGHVFYRSLGFEAPQSIRQEIEKYPIGTGFTWTRIQPDELLDYEADLLLIAAETAEDRKRVEHWRRTLPAWRRHPAVRGNRVYALDWQRWKIYSPHGLRDQLQEAARLLTSLARSRSI